MKITILNLQTDNKKANDQISSLKDENQNALKDKEELTNKFSTKNKEIVTFQDQIKKIRL